MIFKPREVFIAEKIPSHIYTGDEDKFQEQLQKKIDDGCDVDTAYNGYISYFVGREEPGAAGKFYRLQVKSFIQFESFSEIIYRIFLEGYAFASGRKVKCFHGKYYDGDEKTTFFLDNELFEAI